jgi:hypothetical protein
MLSAIRLPPLAESMEIQPKSLPAKTAARRPRFHPRWTGPAVKLLFIRFPAQQLHRPFAREHFAGPRRRKILR